ncbi:MAG: glucose 1-dehydrogenase [Gammaproteobacteria bacterium]|nr:glucose 1-dehydrogenase [Gammaproteobacteria bacterium]
MDKNLFGLSGKIALITGGSRGLGREMALAFADFGADVIVTSRKLDNCEAVAREVRSRGRKALAHACHIGQWEQIGELVDAAYAQFGQVDVLVNNAGLSPLYPSLTDISETLFDKVVALNLKGPFRLSALIGERMAAANGGSIINVSSTAAVTPSPSAEPYGAAKAGLNALTRSLAYAYGPKVKVNAIMPGPFLTDISKAWDMERFQERAQRMVPLRRGGQPNEIVGAALYFASDASSFTTGSVLAVDGGGQGSRMLE